MYNGANWEDNGEEKKNQWDDKTKVNGQVKRRLLLRDK